MEHERLHLAFTGSQKGMAPEQAVTVTAFLSSFLVGRDQITVHHGECIGADAQFHHICRQFGSRIWVVGHPAIIHPSKRDWDLDCDERRNGDTPLERNRDMVDDSSIVIAAPGQMHEILRSGTWATVRYGRKMPHVKDILVVFPDGKARREP